MAIPELSEAEKDKAREFLSRELGVTNTAMSRAEKAPDRPTLAVNFSERARSIIETAINGKGDNCPAYPAWLIENKDTVIAWLNSDRMDPKIQKELIQLLGNETLKEHENLQLLLDSVNLKTQMQQPTTQQDNGFDAYMRAERAKEPQYSFSREESHFNNDVLACFDKHYWYSLNTRYPGINDIENISELNLFMELLSRYEGPFKNKRGEDVDKNELFQRMKSGIDAVEAMMRKDFGSFSVVLQETFGEAEEQSRAYLRLSSILEAQEKDLDALIGSFELIDNYNIDDESEFFRRYTQSIYSGFASDIIRKECGEIEHKLQDLLVRKFEGEDVNQSIEIELSKLHLLGHSSQIERLVGSTYAWIHEKSHKLFKEASNSLDTFKRLKEANQSLHDAPNDPNNWQDRMEKLNAYEAELKELDRQYWSLKNALSKNDSVLHNKVLDIGTFLETEKKYIEDSRQALRNNFEEKLKEALETQNDKGVKILLKAKEPTLTDAQLDKYTESLFAIANLRKELGQKSEKSPRNPKTWAPGYSKKKSSQMEHVKEILNDIVRDISEMGVGVSTHDSLQAILGNVDDTRFSSDNVGTKAGAMLSGIFKPDHQQAAQPTDQSELKTPTKKPAT